MDAICQQGRKDLESRLTRALAQSIRLVFEFNESIEESVEVEATTPATEEPIKKETPVDPMEEFKNDTLIKKALEVFKSTLQTAEI